MQTSPEHHPHPSRIKFHQFLIRESEGFPTPLGSQGWIDIVDLSIARKPEPRTSPHEPRTQAADPPQPQKPKTGLKSDPLGLLDRLDSRGDMVIVINGAIIL